MLDAANADLATAVTQGDNFGFVLSSGFTDFNKPSTFANFMEGHRWIDMRRYDRLNALPLDRGGDIVVRSMPRPESEVTGG